MNSEIDRSKLKKMQLALLSYFIDVCKENNLRYFALGGTALGAVRHGGYIPWDDDIDVGLPRSDYNKLLEILSKQMPDNFILQNFYTEPDYRLPFSKLRDKNTVFKEEAVANLNINHGVYIDIFPIDGFPKNKILQQKLIFRKRLARLYAEKDYKKDKSLPKKLVTFLCKILFFKKSTSDVLKKFDKYAQKFDFYSNTLSVIYGATHLKADLFNKCVYGAGNIVKFENLEIVIPAEYDLYLSQKYGDYMKIPPVEKQITDHHCIEINLGD